MTSLRIVTYNIAHGRGLRPFSALSSQRRIRAQLAKIAKLLSTFKADVVALQEIDQDSSWSGHFDHLEYLRRFSRFPYAIFGVNTRRDGLFHFNYGNAFLSRHPIVDSENMAFGKKTLGEKGFLFMEIDVGGKRVPLVNMHLHHRSRAHRIKQVGLLMDYLTKKSAKTGRPGWSVQPIVCGDLNNPSHTADATRSLFQYFSQHGAYRLFPMDEKTYPSPLPQRTLDFVFLPPNCTDASCRVVKSYLSDHRPVVVDCKLK